MEGMGDARLEPIGRLVRSVHGRRSGQDDDWRPLRRTEISGKWKGGRPPSRRMPCSTFRRPMNPIDLAKQAMLDLHEETKDIASGVIPSLLAIVAIQGRLVAAHWQLSEQCADAYREYTKT